MFYGRENYRLFFVLPTIAFGYDFEDTFFIEIGWINFVIGYSK
jgi:hypothetical protein